MGRVIAIANQKGGVGKTTTSVNLPSALALLGRKVLVVDIDPQGNATSGLGVDKHGLEATLYDVFLGLFNLSSVIVGAEQKSLWVAPANNDLVGAEVELSGTPGRDSILKNQLNTLRKQFDYIFIDCPPSLGLLTINALCAADTLLVPLQCEYYALEGISALMQTVKLARQKLNPTLGLEGVVLTMYDNRTNLARQVGNEARAFFGHSVFDTVIPRNVRLSESPSFGKPIFLYDQHSAGAQAYLELAKEIERRSAERAGGEGEGDDPDARLVANT
ncbi:MAG: ParA family protein [Bdellovibrionales bacterium]|nr:ParA family protein [Bdellovibrionales bacterium]